MAPSVASGATDGLEMDVAHSIAYSIPSCRTDAHCRAAGPLFLPPGPDLGTSDALQGLQLVHMDHIDQRRGRHSHWHSAC